MRTPTAPPRSRWFTAAIALLVVGLVGARVWLGAAYGLTGINDESLLASVVILLAFMPYLVVGLVLVRKRPDHRLGWVLTAIGVLTSAGVLAESYAMVALVARPEAGLPGGVFAAWVQNWYWFPLLALIFLFVPLLFPTGRPLSPRWNWLFYAAVVMLAAITGLSWLKPTLTDGDLQNPAYSVANPIGVRGAGDIESSAHGDAMFIALLVLALCSMTSLVLRFRRSRGLERQQMNLFVFAGALMLVLPVTEQLGLQQFFPESNAFFAVAIALPPIAIGVAVLRYRLYDIDRVISRTLTYALLTALLVAVYLAVVTVLTTVTAGVAGDSPLAVAAATLLAAATFRPGRRRIQEAVDRRFNRPRYDTARTVSAYRSNLRDELDLVAMTEDLRAAVEHAMQPAGTLVWLRPKETP